MRSWVSEEHRGRHEGDQRQRSWCCWVGRLQYNKCYNIGRMTREVAQWLYGLVADVSVCVWLVCWSSLLSLNGRLRLGWRRLSWLGAAGLQSQQDGLCGVAEAIGPRIWSAKKCRGWVSSLLAIVRAWTRGSDSITSWLTLYSMWQADDGAWCTGVSVGQTGGVVDPSKRHGGQLVWMSGSAAPG